MSITLNDVTSRTQGVNSIDGTGSFDTVMRAQLDHLKNEFSEGRLTGEQYAKAYSAIVNVTLSAILNWEIQQDVQAVQVENAKKDGFIKDEQIRHAQLQTQILTAQAEGAIKDNLIKDKQLLVMQEQIETQDKQQLLYAAQTEGYKRDSELKISKLYIDMMATRVSVDEATYDLALAGLTNEATNDVLTKLRQNAGM